MNYEGWVESVPQEIKGDALWRVEAYRLALFAAEMGWHDVTKLVRDQRTRSLSDQLCRALGSISANIAEGYSRGTGRDRAHFYEYALGSARESRDWYYKARHVLGDSVAQHRLALLTQIIRLLLTTVPQQRGHTVRDETVPYQIDTGLAQSDMLTDTEALGGLLQNVPFS
jgi:four helix bundle protein